MGNRAEDLFKVDRSGEVGSGSQPGRMPLRWQGKAQNFENVLEAFDEPIYIIDAETYGIVWMNAAAHRAVSGQSSTCYAAMHHRNIACDETTHPCPVRQVRSTAQRCVIEQVYYDEAGVPHEVQVLAYPIFDESGKVSEVVEMCFDVARERQQQRERRFREQRQFLEQKVESLGEMAGGVTHSFNNLLAGILGHADVALLAMDGSSPARNSVEKIKEYSLKAAELTGKMMAYCGGSRMQIARLDLNTVLDGVEDLVRSGGGRGVEVQIDRCAAQLWLDADADLLKQLIQNLALNAIEALGKREGMIRIATGSMHFPATEFDDEHEDIDIAPGDYVWIEISDSGAGIAGDVMPKVFDPFFSTKVSGRGLGLAVALGIARSHGGTLQVYSERSLGTTFRALFPAAA